MICVQMQTKRKSSGMGMQRSSRIGGALPRRANAPVKIDRDASRAAMAAVGSTTEAAATGLDAAESRRHRLGQIG
jgi:hypothetical protein